MRSNKLIFTAVAILALTATHHAFAEANNAETKLKETLRNVMVQLRTAETDKANLQAEQAKLAEEKKSLEEQAAALKKQATADKESINELNDKVTDKTAELAQLKQQHEKLKQDFDKAVALAQKKEEERAKAAQDIIVLKRTVADRETKNLELYQVGREILTRYEKFGLGQAITAREPFVGITRVKMETLVQDYSDKLADGRVKP